MLLSSASLKLSPVLQVQAWVRYISSSQVSKSLRRWVKLRKAFLSLSLKRSSSKTWSPRMSKIQEYFWSWPLLYQLDLCEAKVLVESNNLDTSFLPRRHIPLKGLFIEKTKLSRLFLSKNLQPIAGHINWKVKILISKHQVQLIPQNGIYLVEFGLIRSEPDMVLRNKTFDNY